LADLVSLHELLENTVAAEVGVGQNLGHQPLDGYPGLVRIRKVSRPNFQLREVRLKARPRFTSTASPVIIEQVAGSLGEPISREYKAPAQEFHGKTPVN